MAAQQDIQPASITHSHFGIELCANGHRGQVYQSVLIRMLIYSQQVCGTVVGDDAAHG